MCIVDVSFSHHFSSEVEYAAITIISRSCKSNLRENVRPRQREEKMESIYNCLYYPANDPLSSKSCSFFVCSEIMSEVVKVAAISAE